MSLVALSKLQFALAVSFHFIFVPLTLGLSVLIAIMETCYVKTKNDVYLKMTKFWGKLFLINFALGVVTGITLEFQFGTNWSNFSLFVGDIFASVLAIEILTAFFLESTMIGVWVFGWKLLSKKAHATVMWIIAFAGNFSAIWILIANAWMQNPVGYKINNGRAELENFFEIITQKYAMLEIFHTLPSAYTLSAFFVIGISAYHFLKKDDKLKIFRKSYKIALYFGIVSYILLLISGHMNGMNVAEVQPSKFAALENHWETQTNAPMYLFSLPDEENETHKMAIGKIDNILSLMAFNDANAKVIGLQDIKKDERPPVLLLYLAFRIMVGIGTFLGFLLLVLYFKKETIEESKFWLKVLILSIPLPYIAIQTGWMVTEVGRQPWIVFKLLKTSSAISHLAQGQILGTLVVFFLLYSFLFIVAVYLIYKNATKTPTDFETQGEY